MKKERLILICLVVLVVGFGGGYLFGQQQDTVPHVPPVDLAWQLYSQGNYEAALNQFNHDLAESPSRVSRHIGKGYSLFHLHRYDEALASFRTAAGLNPDLPPVQMGLGWAHYRLAYAHGRSNFEQALDHFERAIELDPIAEAHIGAGWTATRLGDYAAAQNYFNRALAINNHHSMAYSGLAYSFYKTRQLSQAKENALQAIDINPSTEDARITLGSAYWAEGNIQESRRVLQEVLELNENNPHAHEGLAHGYYSEGNYELAQYHLEREREILPENYKPYHYLAWVQMKQQNYVDARSNFNKALELNPDFPTPLLGLAYISFEENNPDSEEVYNQYVSAYNANPLHLVTNSLCLNPNQEGYSYSYAMECVGEESY